MDKLFATLYRYAEEHQINHYLHQEGKELSDNETMCSAIIEELNDVLSPPWQRRLKEYIYGRDVQESASAEAFFCSGLAMGLYLSGLGSTLTT